MLAWRRGKRNTLYGYSEFTGWMYGVVPTRRRRWALVVNGEAMQARYPTRIAAAEAAIATDIVREAEMIVGDAV